MLFFLLIGKLIIVLKHLIQVIEYGYYITEILIFLLENKITATHPIVCKIKSIGYNAVNHKPQVYEVNDDIPTVITTAL